MQSIDAKWARGYAKQALSDLRAREALVSSGAEKCHRLHFLQMAAEKACKAHLAGTQGHDYVKKSHAYVGAVIPTIARYFYAANNNSGQIKQWQLSTIRHFAKEIEVLAPACDHGDVRPDNSEYPWQNAEGNICVPCEYSFPRLDDSNKTIISLIKLIRTACESYARE